MKSSITQNLEENDSLCVKVIFDSGNSLKFLSIDEAFKEGYNNQYSRHIYIKKKDREYLLRKVQPEPFTTVWVNDLDEFEEEKTGNEWKKIIAEQKN